MHMVSKDFILKNSVHEISSSYIAIVTRIKEIKSRVYVYIHTVLLHFCNDVVSAASCTENICVELLYFVKCKMTLDACFSTLLYQHSESKLVLNEMLQSSFIM